MKRLLVVLVMGAALSACPGPEGADPDATPSPEATEATPAATASATATSNGARSVSEETDDFMFEFSYPAEAGRIPELATLLDLQLDQRRGELSSESVDARREARSNGFPYNKHSYTAEWKVVTELPNWLSLSSDIATYSGGAHGNYTMQSLVWDKEKEEALDAKRLFTSAAALEKALGDRFCDALDRQREQRRGAPLNDEEAGNSFVDCPKIDELEVLVGSSNRRTFNRLTLYAGPYVAGPYVEGAYEVDLPIDRAVLDVVKPQYREAFSARN